MAKSARNHVMVVDDDAELLAELSEALRSGGFRVSAFTDGDRALSAAAHSLPGAILLDLKMKGRTGFQVAEVLKRDPRTNGIPVIAMTGCYTSREHEKLMAACGMQACLIKPFTAEAAVQKLAMVMGTVNRPPDPGAIREEAGERGE